MISREQARKYYRAARLLALEQSPADGGHLIGRDPRRLSQDELRALGHEPISPLAALRSRCVDCCAGSVDEVRKCTAVKCPSWPFRMGVNPWRTPSKGRQEAGRRLAARRAARALHGKSDLPADAGSGSVVS